MSEKNLRYVVHREHSNTTGGKVFSSRHRAIGYTATLNRERNDTWVVTPRELITGQ